MRQSGGGVPHPHIVKCVYAACAINIFAAAWAIAEIHFAFVQSAR
jgi:hypothetical protein